MRLIGITGGIACGKSTVSRELIRRGYPVIDGDQLARELTGPGGNAMKDISAVFGHKYILQDGSLNRREMGRLVFSDPRAREQLDHVMAPHLRSLTEARIRQAAQSGAELCFLDMPLLFEKGYDSFCDSVWCVWLPENLQLDRLMNRDGYSREEAISRMRSVMSSDRKADLSSAVISNAGTIEETFLQVDDLLRKEQDRTAVRPRRRRTRADESVPDISDGQNHEPRDFVERPESSRRRPSDRKTAWVMPAAMKAGLITLAALLAVSLTALLLMRAYLVRQSEQHKAEQRAIDEQYPLMYDDLIRSTAAEYNLSPALVASVIRNESSFRPTAESSVGARGLMQLMPDTAEWIAGKLHTEGYQVNRLYEPETNIRFGCWYLNYLSSLFNGNPLCVICAYHAGQGEISSWLSNPLISSDGKTMELDRLPDGPTKIYAGRVTRDYGIYQAKYYSTDSADPSGADADAR